MVDMKDVLKRLDDKNIHIKELIKGETYPFLTTLYDTHYAMQGDKIISVGTFDTMIGLAYKDKYRVYKNG